ncbi:ABC transporter ATP-binding protein [Shewanella sp. C32]|uniref:ABC transporter ATP-binding protein n=1 Tax=Shewanella electrica TaxID=515560 RepID=A0ABT2FH50_9GAMM|nr:ABC transporter ATP-binding protein [Shewanella electrica]MCH1923554.1 ABC transporter ATP-binding protein [Shewanella electrica]MCS4555650.1 ABC transporter ATP-binding protein [Shewanella electrica]
MSKIALQADKLTKRFGKLTAVNELSLSIECGAIYGFLGPNGCGKSTAIRLLTGLLLADAGEVTVLGQPLAGHEEALKSRIGYMTQKFSLYENLTVLENLRFVAAIYNVKGAAATQRIDELLQLYGLAERTQQLAGTMSGGQRQRLALACATIHQPELLFLDEPTSAVDPENRRDFWERLFDLSAAGTTILVSTHYMDEAERCHGLAILEHGIKRADGAPRALMQAMAANVVEISGDNLRQLKQQLAAVPEVISAAQVGNHLRVLVSKTVADAMELLTPICRDYELALVRPSLEDVFVSCTGGRHVG